jgi:glycosyltransferase involved in cell wall biosynthesis
MDLSIVIPTKNASATLSTLLDSIYAQVTQKSYEVIIVDSFSQDATIDIASKYDLKVIQKETTIYSAQNEGIKAASGRYLYFIGADDTLEAGAIEAMDLGDRKCMEFITRTAAGALLMGIYQQSFVYAQELFALYGDYDLIHPVYADQWFQERLKEHGVVPHRILKVIATISTTGFSTRVHDTTPYRPEY